MSRFRVVPNAGTLLFMVLATLAVLVSILIALLVFAREYHQAMHEADDLRQIYTNEQKSRIRTEVEKAVEYIDYMAASREERLKESVRDRTLQAHALATHLVEVHKGKKTPEEINRLVVEALRPLRYNGGRGYYFAVRHDGLELLFADRPELEGLNLWDSRDTEGKYVIREMVNISQSEGEGFFHYTWTKPGHEGKGFPKIAYIKRFEPFDGFIGTGEYLDDVERDIQRETLERIGKIRFGEDGYIFVVSYDGMTLMNDTQRDLIGKNIWDMTDPNGVKVIQEERRAVENPAGAFITYHWKKPTTGKIAPKVSFLKGISRWEWMVGAGVYLDVVELVIREKEEERKQHAIRDMAWLGVLFLLFLGLSLLLSYLISRGFNRQIGWFISFFQRMEQDHQPVNPQRFRLAEFRTLACSANAMLERRLEAENALRESERRYRDYIENSPNGIFVTDEQGHYLEVNRAACEITGYEEHELLSMSIADLLGEEERDEGLRHFQTLSRVGKSDGEVPYRTKKGERRFWSVSAVKLSETRFLGFCTDVTERRRTELALDENRRLLSDLIEYSGAVIFVKKQDGTYELVNRKWEEVTLHRREHVIGKTDEMLFSPEIGGQFRQNDLKTMASDTIFEQEEVLDNGREIRFFLSKKFPLRDKDGHVTGLCGVAFDITERKQAELALKESEEKFKALAEYSADVIMRFDKNHRHLYVNAAAESITGLKPDLFIGKTHAELGFPEHLVKLWDEAIRQVFQTAEPQQIEFQLPNGIWMDWLLVPEFASDQNVSAVISSARDITERKRVEIDLLASRERAARQRAAITQLVLDPLLDGASLTPALDRITQTLSETIGAARSSIWRLSEDETKVYCLSLYNGETERHDRGEHLDADIFPEYFDAIRTENRVYAEDAWNDPRTSGLTESYLKPLGITSLLDAGIFIEGHLFGVVSLEHIGPKRHWHADEESFASTIAALVAQFLGNTDRKRAEGQLAFERAQLLSIFDGIEDIIYISDINTYEILFVNQALKNAMGGKYPVGGICYREFQGLDEPCSFCTNDDILRRAPRPLSWSFHNEKLGRHYDIVDRIIRWPDGRLVRFELARDVTSRKQSEEERSLLAAQLQQAMKMEAVGRLAGGVAHDFNNQLTAILGNIELARMDISPDSPFSGTLSDIQKAAESAATLTGQLLAFSRKQLIEPKALNPNDLVASLHAMLARLIGEDIHLQFELGTDLGSVLVDPGQFEQVLVNLAINARDAMPDGGSLIIETTNVELDEDYVLRHGAISPGAYVMISITDTGHGMSEEVKRHLFEPFFTTKPKGRGTGLGLATIYGAIKQASGTVDVYSEPNRGSVFKIYLPRVERTAEHLERCGDHRDMPGGTETVLLVEDEEVVRDLALTILQRLGYVTLVAANGEDALALAATHKGRIDLLLTDVVMPGMNGRQLAERLMEIHPETTVLYSSGYTENAIAHHGIIEEGLHFIGKPYTPQALAHKLREVLPVTESNSKI